MRPFLINKKWIDLDHILYITEPEIDLDYYDVCFYAQLMFQDKLTTILFISACDELETKKALVEAKQLFDRLFKAWTNKE